MQSAAVGHLPIEATDEALVAATRGGDRAAFSCLIERYRDLVFAYAYARLRDREEAEDVAQDAFVRAYLSLGRLRWSGSWQSWLMRIVSRKAVDRLRRHRPSVDVTEIDRPAPLHASPSAVVEVREGVAALGAALRELPEAQRECWVLREMGGYSYDEIAEELGVPVSTVRGLLARARGFLITRMEAWR